MGEVFGFLLFETSRISICAAPLIDRHSRKLATLIRKYETYFLMTGIRQMNVQALHLAHCFAQTVLRVCNYARTNNEILPIVSNKRKPNTSPSQVLHTTFFVLYKNIH